jgi:hypothetical protein
MCGTDLSVQEACLMMAKAWPKTLSKMSFLIAAISVMCECDL